MAAFGIPSRLARLLPRLAPDSTAKADSAFTKALDWAIENAWDDAVVRAAALEGPDTRSRLKRLWTSFGKELAAVGAATGGVAAVPTVGTVGSLSASAAEFGWFTKRAAELILTVAALHGHRGSSVLERRAWVLAVVLYGNKAGREFHRMVADASKADGTVTLTSLPLSTLTRINGSLGRKAATRYATRRAAIAAGQAVPFGIGALIGGTANYWATRRLARQADKFFRTLPHSVSPAT
ncbi:MAG: hypothetical protein ABJH68_05760 [Ilumatobacter sp.]|uniref:hypothetical protein n=1 Tax=Ilumatobacter sp. TaxID=1967498 RepID=UPI003299CBDD